MNGTVNTLAYYDMAKNSFIVQAAIYLFTAVIIFHSFSWILDYFKALKLLLQNKFNFLEKI